MPSTVPPTASSASSAVRHRHSGARLAHCRGSYRARFAEALVLAGAVLLPACASGPEAAAPPADAVAPAARLERISTAVPWPRGIAWADGQLVVLARGRHRSAGGPDATIDDRAGALFVLDPAVSEPVVPGATPSQEVQANARVLAEPTAPPFRPWTPSADAAADRLTDRPYCKLAWDPGTASFYVCGYSGIDRPGAEKFRKNATDSVLRYDTRDGRWHVVEAHDPAVVPAAELGYAVSNAYYPHHDPATNPPPHGWVNGPDGCDVAGRYLYVTAKDNSVLVAYDLAAVQDDPAAGPPPSAVVVGQEAPVSVEGRVAPRRIEGHSAAKAHGGYLYLASRTTSEVIRFPLEADGALVEPIVGELIARFDPYDPATDRSAELVDLAFDGQGALYAATKRQGVWRIGVPDPARVYDARTGAGRAPFVDLMALSGNPKARAGNICFDDQDRLYVCSGNADVPGSRLFGAVYRVAAPSGS